jgi:hypothetical protein
MDSANDIAEKIGYQISKTKPIKSIRLDTTSLQSFNPFYFKDTTSRTLLLKNRGKKIMTHKTTVDF